jgi:hypothetical protein
MEINNLSKAIKDISTQLKKDKLTIETVGIRKDTYQNLLPLLFDINIIFNGVDQYNKKVSTTKSDCIFLDGEGVQTTKSQYYIIPSFNKEENMYEYTIEKIEEVNTLEPLEYFRNNGLYFY